MTRVCGAVLIVVAFTAWGSLRASELRSHARLLSALLSALELTRMEIVSRLTPLPDIASRLASGGPEETREFFAGLERELISLGELEFSDIWSRQVSALPLKGGESAALADLGRVLGRCGAEEQSAAISRCMETLARAAEEAEGEAATGGRLRTGLGLTAGLLLAVMLI